MHACSTDPSRRHRELLIVQAGERLLGSMVWMHVVMYRPALLTGADVVRRVEELAGHMADMLAAKGDPEPLEVAVTAANEVLDECCLFLQRWGHWAWESDEFDTAVRRLRVRLDAIARRLLATNVLAS
jgi:hypothetical protein